VAYNGLNWQVQQLPLAAGLQQGTDVRARPQPFLDIARDVAFDELGGIQTRLPYTGQNSSSLADGAVLGGGVVTNVRRIVANDDELVLFTKNSVFSWNAQLSKWVLRGTHLAVAVEETPRFVTTGDQIDGDRAELNGSVVFAWTEGTQVFAAALDKVTGSVLVAPTAVSTAIGRPRLVALATKILFFVEASATLLTVRAIDPAAPGTAISGAGTTVLTTDFNLFYDVVKAGSQDLCIGACRRQTTTSYTVFKVTPALVVTTSTKTRTCDGPIAVATIADGTQTQIVRANSTNIQGDLLTTSTLADVFTAQAIGTVVGTPVNQIAAEFVLATCRVFWSSLETSDGTNASFATKTNSVTTANAVGTQATFVPRVGIASRAFLRDGHVYVWLVFGEDDASVLTGTPLGIHAALQNTYFLYRDDGRIAGKAAFQIAGGYSASTGHLPGVAATTGNDAFAWAAVGRRAIFLDGERQAYAARSPHEVVFTFDDDSARRCTRIGQTLYVAGGFLQQYDGVSLVEVGFHVMPWRIDVQDSGVAGNIAAGAYSWKGTYRYTNAQGETERSTTATGDQITFAAAHFAIVSYVSLYVTNKTSVLPSLEFWRTKKDPSEESDFFLVTGQDPTVTTGANPYIPNDTSSTGTTFSDNFSDATLSTKEANPENGAVLENLAPPGASIIFASDTRIFLLGVTGDPDRGWYSKQRRANEIAAFHDTLTFDIPRDGGAVTAGWFDDSGVLYVGRETAIYAFTGQGKDNLGQGTTYTLARIISQDVGVLNQESVAMTPLGVILKSRKGWYLLAGGVLQYIGGPVADFDGETVLAVDVIETKHEVRILTSARMLVWDYKAATQQSPVGQWGERTISDGVDATIWNGAHVILVNDGSSSQGTKTEQAIFGSAATYGLDVETAWIKLADLQGATSCRKVQVLGEFRAVCLVRMRIAYDYEMDGTTPRYVDDVLFDPGAQGLALIAGNPLQFVHGPKRTKCQAIKVRLTAVDGSNPAVLGMGPGNEGDFEPSIFLSGGIPWDATFLADLSQEFSGELGNEVSMSFTFDDGPAPFSIDVRRDFVWDPESAIWSPLVNNLGVRVICRAGSSPTAAQLEAAILAVSVPDGLFELIFPGTHPDAVVDAAAMAGVTIDPHNFVDGSFGAPSGEAIKLTGLGLEVGTEPGLLFKLLNSAQQR
jgi:hypothetical protein